MKVFVATARGQGARASDFCWTVEGELVMVLFQCDRDGDEIDGCCGCRRALAGLSSSRATTTFAVADLPLAWDDYVTAISDSLKRGGWLGLDSDSMARELVDAAADFPVGEVLERRGDYIRPRVCV